MPRTNNFEIKNVSQQTPEWHNIRKTHIGASDCPVIMGIDPWRTPYQLWAQKLDLVPSQEKTIAMQWGLDNEETARQELENQTGLTFIPTVCVKGWQMASLDGLSLNQKVQAEIKCPRVIYDEFVPANYYAQIQHQLSVTGNDKSFYFVWSPCKNVLIEVVRDEKYIKEIFEKEELFFECLQTKTPPKLKEKDYPIMQNRAWEIYSKEYQELRKEIKRLQEREEQVKNELICLSGHGNAQGSGIKLSKGYRKGSINYQDIPEIKNVDLDKYRKESTEFWKIDLTE
jgi:putative phage-type endonuclease